MWDLPDNAALARVIERVWNAGGVVAAVCHGPAGLVGPVVDGKPLVSGRRVAAFSNEEESAVGLTGIVPFPLESKLRELGGKYESAPTFTPFSVADGRLVTGQNPMSSRGVAEKTLSALGLR